MKLITVMPYKGDSYAGWKLPAEITNTRENKISAQFGRGTADTLRGLTPEEEKKWLPNILGVSVDHPNWREATKDYWCNMVVIVPEEGLILNIDTNDGEPENILQYIFYRFVVKHGDVAKNKNLIEWPKHKYYIIDAEEVKKEQTASFELRNRAAKAFLFLQQPENRDKQLWVAMCLRDKHELLPIDEHELLVFLEAKKDTVDAEKKPVGLQKFISAVNDPDLKEKALLYKYDSEGIIEKNGNSYFYGGEIMGTEKESIAWLKNPINSKSLLGMNEKLKAQTV